MLVKGRKRGKKESREGRIVDIYLFFEVNDVRWVYYFYLWRGKLVIIVG